MAGIEKGMLAWSRAGHDSGSLYVIVGVEGDCVYLADGKNRLLEHPKKKKKKHIQVISKKQSVYETLDWDCIHNEEIKRIIKIMSRQIV